MNTNTPRSHWSHRRTLVLGLSALALASVALAGAGQWTSTGPAGAFVYSFAADSSTPAKVFALSTSGLLRSTDAGVSWTNVNSQISSHYGLATGPSSTLYAIDYLRKRVVHSEDEGLTFQPFPLNLAADNGPISLAVGPTGSSLYVGTHTGVIRSADGGRTWAETSGIPSMYVVALAIDPSNPSTVYAAADAGSHGSVFKSMDSGRTWAAAGAAALSFEFLAIDGSEPPAIYGCGASGVMRSVDGGATWTLLYRPSAYSIAIDPHDSSRLYAATAAGFVRGHVGDSAWSPVRFGPDAKEDLNSQSVAILPTSPSTLLVGGRDGILRSTDGGESWTAAALGANSSIQSVAVNPSAPESVYAGGFGGVFESSNAGASWTAPDLSTPETYALAADPRNPSILFAAGRGLSKSRDGGAIWESIFAGPPSAGEFTALAIAPSDPSVMLAGTIAGTLYKSSDGGRTFQQTGSVPVDDSGYPPSWRSIAFDPSNPSIAYAAGDPAAYFGEHGFVQKTVDDGASWVDLGEGGSGAFSIVVDPQHASTVYLATREGLRKSLDGGTSWISLTGPPGALVIDPVVPSTIYSGGHTGVFQSLDGGTSWAPLGPGLSGTVTSLAISPDGRRLYAAAAGRGVLDYDLGDGGPCEAGPDSLCLLGGRFRVTFFAIDSRRGRSSSGVAVAQGDRFGYFSLPAFTGDSTLPEVFIKMVDASRRQPGAFWVFYNGLTNLPYTLVVTDTSTGARRVYQSEGFCGGADTAAFAAESSVVPTTLADVPPGTATLSASGSELVLLDGRFHVVLSATSPRDGRSGEGTPVAQGDRFGYFSLPSFTGDSTFPEVVLKMIDGAAMNGEFWFFHSGLTGLSYTLTVTDSFTGAVRTYQNGSTDATRYCGGADVRAFPK